MVLLLPLVLVLVAELATLAGISALRKTYDSDFYLPGGVAFGPRGQNRKLYLACLLQLLAWAWYTVWVGRRLGLAEILPAALAAPKISAAAIAAPYLLAMLLIVSVGRHLGRFSDLRMTRPDGSEILPMDLMRPLSLAVNAYGTLSLLVPLLLYLDPG
ncbi:MAG: hypothetical protein KF760_07415 [Candidatus Eremiobacteraeota bacterium]|nr:hypothetical protein [Candidatus Eremiobacteraeota bacterium]MCW5869768.1 hypothetical protein [Candidatus Eremiobacteraeota bacterium]